MAAGEVACRAGRRAVRAERHRSSAEPMIFVLSIAAALAFWELISRTGVDLAEGPAGDDHERSKSSGR